MLLPNNITIVNKELNETKVSILPISDGVIKKVKSTVKMKESPAVNIEAIR